MKRAFCGPSFPGRFFKFPFAAAVSFFFFAPSRVPSSSMYTSVICLSERRVCCQPTVAMANLLMVAF